MTDTNELKKLIEERGVTITHIAKCLDISREALYLKINGKTEFKASEVYKMMHLLRMSAKERDAIFFATKSE